MATEPYRLNQTGVVIQGLLDQVSSGQVNYLTTAPESDNLSGKLIFVILTSEPATYYDGYLYCITEASGG